MLAGPGVSADDGAPEHYPTPPRLRNAIVATVLFAVLVIALLVAVPGLHGVLARLGHAEPVWVAAAVGLELLSCASFVVLFERVFYRGGRALTARLAWSEMAANALISAGGTSGLALGAWVLRSRGVPAARIAERSVFLFVMTSAPNVAGLALFGVAMGAGLLGGTRDPLLTWLPAAAALAVIAAALVTGRLAQRHGGQLNRRSRMGAVLGAIGTGILDTERALAHPDRKLVGATGYWLFDNAALWAALAAFGRAPAVGVVVMAYLVGMLGNELPLPGGIGGVEAGLVGMLVLYGVSGTEAAAGVLIYRACSLLVPGLIGTLAFLDLRRLLSRVPPPSALVAPEELPVKRGGP